MKLKTTNHRLKDRERGAGIIWALILAVVLGIVGANIATKMAQRVKIANMISLKTEARSVLNYIGGKLKNPAVWAFTLAKNPPLKNYYSLRKGASPRQCPRQEECASPAAPAFCAVDSLPPPCDAESQPLSMIVMDESNKVLIDRKGAFIDRDWNFSATRQTESVFLVTASWIKKANHEVNKKLDLHLLRADENHWQIASMIQPARACMSVTSAPMRPSYRTFPGWVYAEPRCPENYIVTFASKQLHPVHKWPSITSELINNGTAVACATVPESAWVIDLQRNGSRVGIASPTQDYSAIIVKNSSLPRHDNVCQAICCWKGDEIKFYLK